MCFATRQDVLDVETDHWLRETNDDGLAGLSSFSFRAARPDLDRADAGDSGAFTDFRLQRLTAAELELLLWVADGWTMREIAQALSISEQAAKKRVQRLRRRAETFINRSTT